MPGMHDEDNAISRAGILSRRLKEARLRSGLSQERLGVLAGIDEYSASARMNQYERGKHSPHFEVMARLAKVLGISVTYFYAEDDQEAELLLLFAGMKKRQREQLVDYVRKLVDGKPGAA